MRNIYRAYRQLLGILWKEAPVCVAAVFVLSAVTGVLSSLLVYANQHVFDDGLLVAQGLIPFSQYAPYLVLLALCMIVPPAISGLMIYGLIESRMMMILNTSFKGKLLEKLARMKYEHYENEADVEVIDKAFYRAENSARHLFPNYVFVTVQSLIASIGTLILLGSAKWYLIPLVLFPYLLQTWWKRKHNANIYDELEHYWNKQRQYGILAGFLKKREYLYEGKLNQSSDDLIHTYRTRLKERNREYERYYFRHLKQYFTMDNIANLCIPLILVVLLWLYVQGEITVGMLASLSVLVAGSAYGNFSGALQIFVWSGYHIKFFDYYNRFLALSEEAEGENVEMPAHPDVEFRDVHFRYPGNPDNPEILRGVSFHIAAGEKVSLVGENGEGKSTLIKLLLGLFEPDSGEIRIGGRPLSDYSRAQRSAMLAPVFQDFSRFSISLAENIAVGDVERLGDRAAMERAAKQGGADGIAKELKDGYDTLLGKDFEGGTDLSGGQWQRIALARAFMGNKPILLLDEPTSQLDPMAESKLYQEFAQMAEGKTALFITHRLASTRITDQIFVLSKGRIAEQGTHAQLMEKGGIYAVMFEAQKKWYTHNEEASA